jgi:hypothetical protein
MAKAVGLSDAAISHADDQFAAYLLDVLMFYLSSVNGNVVNHPVLSTYARLLDATR